MKRIVTWCTAVVTLAGLAIAVVVSIQTWRLERRLPGQHAEGDTYRWYCVVPPSEFGLCSRSAPRQLLPEDDDAKVRRANAVACLFNHRISTDEHGAVCAFTVEGCEAVRRGFLEAADLDEISECRRIDLLDLHLRRLDAAVAALALLGVGLALTIWFVVPLSWFPAWPLWPSWLTWPRRRRWGRRRLGR